ncbi:MAG: T9SS type A sorting domain-containing protein [Gemmatimonadetes bacterium]|nr:T9SS type A sorting domain-containing protein [Gemmatimonadota bacterium]MYK40979.1 T9SS type A sorting domain-containing protein [Gemmatimonadota bacterium]
MIHHFSVRFVLVFIACLASSHLCLAYTFHWEIDQTLDGTEEATLIEPVKVVLSGQAVEVASHSASLFLKQKYSVHLNSAWSAEQAHGLLQTFESIPQNTNDPSEAELTVQPSVWRISQRHIENDIEIKIVNGQRVVTIAEEAFTYARPLMAEIDGVRGHFFSKRLHRAVVRFVTDNGASREVLEHILFERYGISLQVDYRELTRNTTQEGASRFMSFKDEELLAIISMLEESPKGMLHTPGLDYMVRRLDGTPHPFYPQAPAVAWPQAGYIEFAESAFKSQGLDYMHRLIVHEKAHFLWEHLFDEQLKRDWIELGGWYFQDTCQEGDSLLGLVDCERWSTTKQTEFVSAYAHAHDPNEDMAESISDYIVNPDKLRSRSPAKYEFIQNRIMHGTRYISQIREDLTFEVYNLYPDNVYPGRIIRVDIQVDGKPKEDKEVTIEIELHNEGDQDTAQASAVRVYSERGTSFDIWLYPIDSNGHWVETSHILRGHETLSKYAAAGYWRPTQISLRDPQGNERHGGQNDFGWGLYLDNPLADDTAPQYVPGSMKLSLSEGSERGRAYQILTATWDVIEENGVTFVFAYANDEIEDTYSRLAEYGTFDPKTNKARVDLIIPDYFPSGRYEINYVNMQDDALNRGGVYFTRPGHDLRDEPEAIDEKPASIQIKTTRPDTAPPVLDLNNIKISAVPTKPEKPDGETIVDISFRVKDNISGYRNTGLYLRDPQGTEHHFWHGGPDQYNIYFVGDPTVYKTYEKTIVLPVGSIPGTWGLAEMNVSDKAHNVLRANFTEIVRFEVSEASAKPVADAWYGLPLSQNWPNPFNSQTTISYFLNRSGSVRLDVWALNGQRIAVLREGKAAAGRHSLVWDGLDRHGREVASGVYLYRLITDQGVFTQKLTLIK